MPQATLDAVISQINALEPDELRRVENAVQERLKSVLDRENSKEEKETALDQALLAAGLITRIPPPRDPSKAERPTFQVSGEPLSETILRERR